MTAAGSKKLLLVFCLLLLFYFTCFSPAFAQHLNAPPAKKNLHPKISSYLQKLEKEFKEGAGTDQLVAQGVISGSTVSNRVPVYLMSAPGTPIDETALANLGVEITKRSGHVIRAQVPIDRLTDVSDSVSGISFMKATEPLIPAAAVTSEGVDLTGADTYHTAGYDGSGVKIAVIDVGFKSLSDAINHGELPNTVVKVDCTGSSCLAATFSTETDDHGTAVAEIVYDMAPGAQLYLIKVADKLDLSDAKDYAIQNGINIINLSGGYLNQNFYDGRCWSTNAVCTASDAYAHDILWVNSAGNEAQRHYEAEFTDPDSNGWHNVSPSNETIRISANEGDIINLYLTWDAWPTTDQDFDLYLYDDSNVEVDHSLNAQQTVAQGPTEHISYIVPTNKGGNYYIAIYNNNVASNPLFELYSVNHNLTPAVAASSLLTPADAAGVMAVGAINYNYWATGPQDVYSSRGPTTDGRLKPDIMGPDHVSNFIEGIFAGTSASSPHVTGGAALVLQKNPGFSAAQLSNSLADSAIDMGDPNIYGNGRLNLDINATVPNGNSDTTGDSGIGGNNSSTTSAGGGGGCFIATAAYGSYEAPYVLILRKMRDRFLITNAVGKAFVHLYYTYSPPMADIIANHNSLKIAVRIGLLPLVGISWLALKTGPVFTLLLLAACLTFFVLGFIRLFTRRMFYRRNKTLAQKSRLK
jgi:subtilisin family serine protease